METQILVAAMNTQTGEMIPLEWIKVGPNFVEWNIVLPVTTGEPLRCSLCLN